MAEKPTPDLPEGEQFKTVTVRMRADMARMIRTICSETRVGDKPLKFVDFLDEELRDRVTARYQEILQKRVKSPKKRKED